MSPEQQAPAEQQVQLDLVSQEVLVLQVQLALLADRVPLELLENRAL